MNIIVNEKDIKAIEHHNKSVKIILKNDKFGLKSIKTYYKSIEKAESFIKALDKKYTLLADKERVWTKYIIGSQLEQEKSQ